ncbi:hypothetical protein D3C72_1853680 [compost metagenome]
MTADAIGQQTGLLVDDSTDHCDVFTQLTTDQPPVDMTKDFRRLEFRQGAVALGFEQQARGHELQQHGDEG